jgi:hypothetical protein
MDSFKYNQLHKVGIGGMKCYCCNRILRRNGKRNVDRIVNGIARARMKISLNKELSNLE